jgi:BirA family biotin operon repressor/biotin-[acetyl-CoA-carboxylase] ligase
MKQVDEVNPFGAPVYYIDVCTSTMDEARSLAAAGAPYGTVVRADFQTKGRGRFPERQWTASPGKNVSFTLILKYPDFSSIPAAITLRAGLAAARAIESMEPVLAAFLAVKWPNDVMLDNKKCAGIITESDGRTVLIGIGVNIAETDLPDNAVSIASALAKLKPERAAPYMEAPHRVPFTVERILYALFDTLSPGFDSLWREELEQRLYMKGRTMRFTTGIGIQPEDALEGVVSGIDPSGSLLLIPADKTLPRVFAAGELSASCMSL